MADNLAWTPGSGATIAADDVSGVHYQRVKLVDGAADSSALIGGDATNGLDVDVTRIIPGTSATHLGKAEDAAHASGDTGVMLLAVRLSDANSLTPLAGADGDYIPFTTDNRGIHQVVARPVCARRPVASAGLTTSVTAYSVGDTTGTLMTFTNCARTTGGTGTLRAATLIDKGDVGVDYRLHIYRASVTLAADNAAWSVSDTDQESLIAVVPLPSMLDLGGNRVATLSGIDQPYDCAATSLFVGIETQTANAVYTAVTDLYLSLFVALD